MTGLRAATVQFHHHAGDKDYNLAVIDGFARQARDLRVQMLAFPEMCITGYWHVRNLDRAGLEKLAEPIGTGPSVERLRALARQGGMLIGAGLIERAPDGQLYNSYAVCLPDGSVHAHRKLHSFEHEEISSGDRFTVFDTPWNVRVGVLICWDNNLVENARATALLGADVLLAPHQTGGCLSRSPHAMGLVDPQLWRDRARNPEAITAEFQGDKGRGWLMRWLPSRAHDNGMFILFANGVGEDDGEVRTGNAMIIDPYGRIVAESKAVGDAMVTADLDLDLLPLATGRRWIRGRRPELYGLLARPKGNELKPREARFSSEPVAKVSSAPQIGCMGSGRPT